MLGVLCARPKPWIVAALSFLHGGPTHHRLAGSRVRLPGDPWRRRLHSSACLHGGGGATSVWHAILPAVGDCRRSDLRAAARQKGEGSWNVFWDARPARWLHRPDSAWLLFGVCSCLAAPLDWTTAAAAASDVTLEPAAGVDEKRKLKPGGREMVEDVVAVPNSMSLENSANFKVTGVLADGRCLFRAIAHGECLRNGEEAPNEMRQRELADELRAKVVDELSRRRKETEWFIEGDFDAYINRIQLPYVWGGEPELLMASHVLKIPISVSMIDRTSGNLVSIADYGEEYRKDKDNPIHVLFHGYGHYDLLEIAYAIN